MGLYGHGLYGEGAYGTAAVLTATEDSAFPPRLIVAASGLSEGSTVSIFRVQAGERTTVRGADEVELDTDTSLVVYDGEFPFGTPISYVVTEDGIDSATLSVITSYGFEGSVGNWVNNSNATVADSSAQAHSGVDSMRLTSIAGGAMSANAGNAATNGQAVTPGDIVTVSGWFKSAVSARTCQVGLQYFTSGGGFVSTVVGALITDSTSAWTEASDFFVVPATAAFARAYVQVNATGGASEVHYVDDVDVSSPSSSITVTLPGGKVALSDAITGLSAEVVITAWPEKQADRASTTFTVGGRKVVVSAPRGASESQVEFLTETESSRQQMLALLDGCTSGIILIRQPGDYEGVDGTFFVVSDTESRAAQNGLLERRLFTLDLIESPGWAPEMPAAGWTYDDVDSAYASSTYADLDGDFGTYLEIATFDWGLFA